MSGRDRLLAKTAYHAAPIKMGLKPGALFCLGGKPECDSGALAAGGGIVRRCLGLDLADMLTRRGDTLALVHCPVLLGEALASAEARDLLAEAGYLFAPGETAAVIDGVRARCLGESFPHEVGLLLGYPAGDVRRFMRHGRGRGGCGFYGWRVYGDWARAAERARRCREAKLLAARLVLSGVDWEELGQALTGARGLRDVV
ncbi:MAG: DUF3793 family protein [Planctomycetota bacterium]|nr:DUF3793 family protein [Planctomycetota bacterium]